MEYIDITAAVCLADADRAADVLRAHTGLDVSIEAPFTQVDLESDAVPDEDGTALAHVYVPQDDAGRSQAASAGAAFEQAGICAEVTSRDVAEEDWAESWKQHVHVQRFGRRVVVVPSWRTYDAEPGDAVVNLDPGMAFGTGQHETTRMCLEALEEAVQPGMRVLDVGCGSGILSIAAAKLGAAHVVALDVDANCVRVTRDNVAQNFIDGAVHSGAGSVGEDWPLPDPPAGFDVVVANIIARVIVSLAGPLVDALTPSGRLIVSGVIGEREAEVCDALESAGARIFSKRAMGDWRCIQALRR